MNAPLRWRCFLMNDADCASEAPGMPRGVAMASEGVEGAEEGAGVAVAVSMSMSLTERRENWLPAAVVGVCGSSVSKGEGRRSVVVYWG